MAVITPSTEQLLADLLDLPEDAHKSDFVISLTDSVARAERTLETYVVTPQLQGAFRQALSLVYTALSDNASKGAWLHSSFGGGKSHFMSVLTLTLQQHPGTRAKEGLAEVIHDYEDRLQHRNLLVVPLNMIGAVSVESAVLGGYVRRIAELQPEAAVPAVYLAEGLFDDARVIRERMGDVTFFSALGGSDDDDGWGDLSAGWTPETFEAAIADEPGSSARRRLVGDLVSTFFTSLQATATATGEALVNLDEGLGIISSHAKEQGYDGIVLMLDEVVLWFATQMGDEAFVKREGPKVAKLVESGTTSRPAPIVTFIARQKDLRDLVGDHVTHAEQLNLSTILSWWEGRFDTINLEMDNLRAIVQKRLLAPKSALASDALDRAFQATTGRAGEKVVDTLCTNDVDRAEFRRVYPFSPALLSAVVDLSSVLQRERTALRVLAQLLVDRRSTMRVGDLVPVGDLYDVIASGDEPFGTQIKQYWETARRLYDNKLRPMLLRHHQLTDAGAEVLDRGHAFHAEDRLLKTVLLAAIVPGSSTLGNLTASRLAALNHGSIKSPIPGQERAVVLGRLRDWQREFGELNLDGDPNDPTVTVQLVGVDTDGIIRQADGADNTGARRSQLKRMLFSSIGIDGSDSMLPTRTVLWKGTKRTVDVVFGNMADANDIIDSALEAGERPKIVIDYPFGENGQTPADDYARVENYVNDHDNTLTVCWLPQFLSPRSLNDLGTYVVHDHVLTGENFDRYSSHLSVQDRPIARQIITNRRDNLFEQLRAALRQAYAVDEPKEGTVELSLSMDQQFSSLEPTFTPRRPTAANLQDAFDKLAGQILLYKYPEHPEFDDEIRTADLRAVLAEVTRAAEQRADRIDIAGTPLRRIMRRIANPLRLGEMFEAHYVPGTYWADEVSRRLAEQKPAALTVGLLRRWLDEPRQRGLTREVQDLVILSIAVTTDRVLTRGTSVVAGEIGRLDDAIELHTQALPSAETWSTAISKAASVFGVMASPAVTAAGVARMVTDLRSRAGDALRAVLDAESQVTNRVALRSLPVDVPRARTAAAARALIDTISGTSDDANLVHALATTTAPTTDAALGSAISQAAKVATALREANWDLLDAASSLQGDFAGEAALLRAQVNDALSADEFVTPMGPALLIAIKHATDLMTRAATPSTQPPSNGGADEGEVVAHEAVHGLAPAAALAQLDNLREQLSTRLGDGSDDITVDLSWTVRRGGTQQ